MGLQGCGWWASAEHTAGPWALGGMRRPAETVPVAGTAGAMASLGDRRGVRHGDLPGHAGGRQDDTFHERSTPLPDVAFHPCFSLPPP